MSSRHGKGVLALAACVAFCVLAAPAQASFHLVKIRQIHPSTGTLGGEWIELQLPEAGENLVGGKLIRSFFPDGSLSSSYTIPGNAPNGDSQRTILISSLFTPAGVPADFVAPVDQLQFTGMDGAVCYTNNDPPQFTPIDCVSYGNFVGSIPSAGTPAVATPFEQTLERKIGANCSTALDVADDTNNSAADFALSTNPPRNNSTPPTEKTCSGPGSGGTKPPPGSNFKCKGKAATLIGTSGKDKITGTKNRDVIVAFSGNDTVNGTGGNDVLCGNGGKDKLIGGKGKDLLVGGPKADKLIGGAGKDTLSGQGGNDTCLGGPGKDTEKSCGTASASAPTAGPAY